MSAFDLHTFLATQKGGLTRADPYWIECRRFDSLTAREWRLFLFGAGWLRPRRARWRATALWLGYLWRKWTVLPGDVWRDPSRDEYVVIHSGRPGHVRGQVITAMCWNRYGREFCEANAPVEPVEL